MPVELNWIFAPAPFDPAEIWEWPMAFYRGPMMRHAAYVISESPYSPTTANSGNHLPLNVVIMAYNTPMDIEGKGRRMLDTANRFRRLDDAITFVQWFLTKHPEWRPKMI